MGKYTINDHFRYVSLPEGTNCIQLSQAAHEAYVMATCDVDVDEAYARVKKAGQPRRQPRAPGADWCHQLHGVLENPRTHGLGLFGFLGKSPNFL